MEIPLLPLIEPIEIRLDDGVHLTEGAGEGPGVGG